MKRESRERRVLQVGITLLGGVLLLEILFNLFLAPRLRIGNITVNTNLVIEDRVLLELTGLDRNNWFFSVRSDEVARSLEALAPVKEARVEKQFPNRLHIDLEAREPLLMFLAPGEGELIPLLLDEQGVAFLTGREVFSYDLPLLGGVVEEGDGKALPDDPYLPLLEDMGRLKETSPDLFGIISEIKVVPKDRGVIDIELYLTTHTIPVLLDLPVTSQKIYQAVMVVDVMEKEGLSDRIGEVDLRAGSVVYSKREVEGV